MCIHHGAVPDQLARVFSDARNWIGYAEFEFEAGCCPIAGARSSRRCANVRDRKPRAERRRGDRNDSTEPARWAEACVTDASFDHFDWSKISASLATALASEETRHF